MQGEGREPKGFWAVVLVICIIVFLVMWLTALHSGGKSLR